MPYADSAAVKLSRREQVLPWPHISLRRTRSLRPDRRRPERSRKFARHRLFPAGCQAKADCWATTANAGFLAGPRARRRFLVVCVVPSHV